MNSLKLFVVKMWTIVIDQMERSKTITIENDLSLVNELNSNERRIDSFELKIDMDVEEILDSHSNQPREIISILKKIK